jgi:drug/metabolite transporter (DMT)-like permease
MWILLTIASLIFGACMETVDKIAIVKDKTIDLFAATFWRNLLFLVWIAIFATFGVFGHLSLFITWPVVLVAVLFTGSSFFYTYLLKKIEVTSQAALSYASPAFYLIIDAVLLKLHFSAFQALGILLLTGGGILFTIDPKGGIRKEFTPRIWMIFVYEFLVNGVEYYGFKYYFLSYQMNEISYFFNIWLVMMILLLLVVVLQGRWKTLWKAAQNHHYFAKSALSKFFDAAQSLLWLNAIALAAVSQVNAVNSLFPVILIGVVFVTQNIFGFKAEEEFSKGRLSLKLAAVALLCVGGFFIR